MWEQSPEGKLAELLKTCQNELKKTLLIVCAAGCLMAPPTSSTTATKALSSWRHTLSTSLSVTIARSLWNNVLTPLKWFGLEQEYTLLDLNDRPYGWPANGESCLVLSIPSGLVVGVCRLWKDSTLYLSSISGMFTWCFRHGLFCHSDGSDSSPNDQETLSKPDRVHISQL
jgi:hypothetical protein